MSMRSFALLGVLASSMLAAAPSFASPGAPGSLVPPYQPVDGHGQDEWSAEWYQYVLSTPQDPNPLLDPTGNSCTLVQHGQVWFLTGTTGGSASRACTIPEGKYLFFPLINIVDINTASQPVRELRAEIRGCLDNVTDLLLEVDGVAQPMARLLSQRMKSPAFEAVIPPNGVPTVPPVPADIYSPAVADGYYAMLRPLSVGTHTVRLGGASPGCTYAPTSFSVPPWTVFVTYTLTVKPVTLR